MPENNSNNFVQSLWNTARKSIASPWIRRNRSVLFQFYILFALLGFSALAMLANTTPYFRMDLLFTREVQADAPSWFGHLLQWVSLPGYTVESIAVIAIAFIILAAFGLRWEAWSALFAAVSSGALNTLVKVVIRRPRPTSDLVNVFSTLNSYSFPSGHVMFYTAFFGFLLFLVFILLKRSILRGVLSIILGGLVMLVGLSRMYLGEHWASDVLGAYLLGSLVLILTIQFYHWGKKRFIVEQPVAPSDGKEVEILKEIPVTSKKDNPHDNDSDRLKRK